MMQFTAAAFLTLVTVTQATAAPVISTVEGQVFVVTKGQNAIKLALVNVVAASEKDLRSIYFAKLGDAAHESNELASQIEVKKTLVNEMKAAVTNTEGYSWLDELQRLSKVCDPTKSMSEWSACIRTPEGKAALEKMSELRTQNKPAYDALTAARTELRMLQKRSRVNLDAFRALTRPYKLADKYLAQTKTDADGKFRLSVPVGQRVAIMAESERTVGDKNESYQWIVWATPKKGARLDLTLANDNLLETKCGDCFVSPVKLKVFPDLREYPENIVAIEL